VILAYTDAYNLINSIVTTQELSEKCYELYGQVLTVIRQSTPDLVAPNVRIDPVGGENMLDKNQNTLKTMAYNLHFELPYYNDMAMEKAHAFLDAFEDVLQINQVRTKDSYAFVKMSSFSMDELDPKRNALDLHYRVDIGLLFLR
jgi:hypothetical protein